MRTDTQKRNDHSQFAPLDLVRAEELKRLINLAARDHEALVIDPKEGLQTRVEVDLISPNAHTNALVRFQRHY